MCRLNVAEGEVHVMRNIVYKKNIKNIEIIAILASLIFLAISYIFSWDSNSVMGLDKLCSDVVVALLCVAVIRFLGLWDTAGFRSMCFWKGILYGSPFFAIGIGSIIISNIGIDISNLKFISISNAVLFTINMILVGINEELWMRSFVLNGLLKKYGVAKNSAWKALFVSALIFGAIHIPNILFMEPLTVIVQSINAASAGILFGAIFIKTKNVWAVIVIHSIVDWISLFIGNCFTGSSTILDMKMNIFQAVVIILLGSFPPILITCWILKKNRPRKHINRQNNHSLDCDLG